MQGHRNLQQDFVPVAVDPLLKPEDPIRTGCRLLDPPCRKTDCAT